MLLVAMLASAPAHAASVQVFAGVDLSLHLNSSHPFGIGLNVDTSFMPMNYGPDVGTFTRLRWTGFRYATLSAGGRAGLHVPMWIGYPTYAPGFGADFEYGWTTSSGYGSNTVIGGSIDSVMMSARYSQLGSKRLSLHSPQSDAKDALPNWRPRRSPLERTIDIGARAALPGTYWIEGRPMRTERGVQMPSIAFNRAALAHRPSARRWLKAGADEHSAVHAFAQLATELSRLGAPRELVGRAWRAVGEEAGHARLCYGMAARQLGSPVRVQPMQAQSRAMGTRAEALVRLALESFVDGELGEGDAADRALKEAHSTADPLVREVKSVIAREERGHADLAKDIIAWCRQEGGGVVRRALASESRLC